ncbi:hypothetical protein [Rhizobium arsenicireducens]
MKQIEKTPRIRDLLTASIGAGQDLDALRVYEAIAFNTLPVRKQHPLYFGARADRTFLLEMAAELRRESRPVQIQHDSEPLPIGRVFHGELVDMGIESELRVLFFLDPTANAEATKIEAGTVDQVSVSVLAKKMLNSVSGFDYFGDDATIDNIWSGLDNDGNQIGKNGVYAQMVGLDKFFEMSLVGQGGAQNARIVSRDRSHFGTSLDRLAASGMDPNSLVLTATSKETAKMDLSTLVADLTSKAVDLTNSQRDLAASTVVVATLTATVAERDASIVELTAQLAAANNPAVALAAGERDEALAALKATAKTVLTKAGKLDVQVPETVTELAAVITEHTAVLTIAPGGTSKETITDLKSVSAPNVSAFRSAR